MLNDTRRIILNLSVVVLSSYLLPKCKRSTNKTKFVDPRSAQFINFPEKDSQEYLLLGRDRLSFRPYYFLFDGVPVDDLHSNTNDHLMDPTSS